MSPPPELVKDLKDAFRGRFGIEASTCVAAPGRVNIIGEHIDYNGFGVFPCAIGRYSLVALGVLPGVNDEDSFTLRMSSTLPKYSDRTCESLDIHQEHHWTNYVLAAAKGIASSLHVELPKNLCLLTSGNLPCAAGLSSSSSLVCATALALVSLMELNISREDLTNLCIESERFVGTASGGMDQAAILLSKEEHAMKIDFNPLKVEPFPLPSGISFVIANSLASSEKAESAPFHYNKRFFECRAASYVLSGGGEEDVLELTLAKVKGEKGWGEMEEEVRRTLKEGPYSKSEVSSLLPPSLREKLFSRCGEKVWELNEEFFLRERAMHVYGEAKRVEDFVEACSLSSPSPSHLGSLLSSSNRSCHSLYDCSHPSLLLLTSLCEQGPGSRGSRLTGAGWGGCCVTMVDTDRVPEFLEFIREKYYSDLKVENENIANYVFAVQPVGAAYLL